MTAQALELKRQLKSEYAASSTTDSMWHQGFCVAVQKAFQIIDTLQSIIDRGQEQFAEQLQALQAKDAKIAELEAEVGRLKDELESVIEDALVFVSKCGGVISQGATIDEAVDAIHSAVRLTIETQAAMRDSFQRLLQSYRALIPIRMEGNDEK